MYVPGFDRTLEQPLAAALVVLPTARLVVTEGNYLLLDEPALGAGTPRHGQRVVRRRARRRCGSSGWWRATSSSARRHARRAPGSPTTDQRNAELVSGTAGTADRVIVNGADGWDLG